MAEINTRKRGNTWEYRFEAAKVDGKRKQITKGGFRTKKEALEAGTKACSEYNDAGLHFVPSEISFSDYLQFWLTQYCEVNLKHTTCENYSKKIRLYIKPELGLYKLKSLTPAILQAFINTKFNEGYSRNTISVIKGILSGSLDYAVEPLQFIRNNPMKSVKNPSPRAKAKTPSRSKNRRSIKPEEWEIIISRFPERHPSHIPLQLGYRCGLRLGEAFAVTWDDIDFDNKILKIKRQVQMINGFWTFVPPKYDSTREIMLDEKMLNILKEEKARQERAKIYYEQHYIQLLVNNQHQINTTVGESVNLVNVRENGEYIQPRTTQHIGRVVHYHLNIADWDFHSLRHTHTTMLIEAGVNPVTVQKRLGHKNIETTLGIYAESTKKMENDMIEKLNEILG